MIAPDLRPLARPITTLHVLPGNPRRGDVEAVARSLEKFGQRKPITALPDGTVTAGNHTLMAAKLLGWDEIAVSITDDDEATAKAWALADNRTAELGSYDDEALAEMISSVRDLDPELLESTGWTDDDLAKLLDSLEPAVIPREADPDAVPAGAPAKTARGDVWQLGRHRVMCGDCRVATDVDRLIGGRRINLAFTSPPYAQQRAYDPESEFRPIPPGEYVEWFAPVAENVAAYLADDGSWFVNLKQSAHGLDSELWGFDLVIAHARQWGWHFVTEFCWERAGFPQEPNGRFKNQFEPIYQFARNRWKHRPDAVRVESDSAFLYYDPANRKGEEHQGKDFEFDADRIGHGLAYPGNRLPTFAGSHTATGHGAAFPVGLPAWFMRAYTDPLDTVYDPFCGSGSTIIAAENEDRSGFGMEISPAYVDVICKRFQELTGILPIAESTGNEHDFCGDE